MTDFAHKSWIAYTDGASRGNPGIAGCGAHIISPQQEEHGFKRFLGTKTNNQAEYEAVILALEHLTRFKADHVTIRADSELMVKQMNGEYKVKNSNILPLYTQVKDLTKNFTTIHFEHVRREFNKEADKLANEAIDDTETSY